MLTWREWGKAIVCGCTPACSWFMFMAGRATGGAAGGAADEGTGERACACNRCSHEVACMAAFNLPIMFSGFAARAAGGGSTSVGGCDAGGDEGKIDVNIALVIRPFLVGDLCDVCWCKDSDCLQHGLGLDRY